MYNLNCNLDYCFVKPIKNTSMFQLGNEQQNFGVLKYSNAKLNSKGVNEGDLVVFTPNSEFEFIIEGEKLYCMNCGHTIAYDFTLDPNYVCSHCKKSGKVRVDVVWFGEQPKYLEQIYKFLDKTEVFISIGTSNNVYPAAGFIDYILSRKKKTLLYEFNLEQTVKSVLFTRSFKGYASKTLPNFINLVSNRKYKF